MPSFAADEQYDYIFSGYATMTGITLAMPGLSAVSGGLPHYLMYA
ncbi:hypothetical protein [Chitinophaga solisilvae]|nr:hypothetical protein [Chitinophaga solisilvae]